MGALSNESAAKLTQHANLRCYRIDSTFHPAVLEYISSELNELAAKLAQNPLPEDAPQHLIAGLVIQRAIASIREDGRPVLFRKASRSECDAAQAPPEIKKEEDLSAYFLFETYGFRFALLINITKCEGSVLAVSRVTATEDDVGACLRAAEARRVALKSGPKILGDGDF